MLRWFPAIRALLCAGALAVAVAPVSAQSEARVVVAVDGGLQPAGAGFSDRIGFDHPVFGFETGEIATSYRGGGGALVDASVRVRIVHQLAVGVGVSLHRRDGGASISARLPHPFLFDQPRRSALNESGLGRRELASHVPILWMIPAGRSVVALFGGPTFFNVTQDLIAGVRFDQEYPYGTATAIEAWRGPRSGTEAGFHVGAEFAFYFSSRVGLGGMVRYSQGSVDLSAPGGSRAVAIEAGGVQTSGGLRLRF